MQASKFCFGLSVLMLVGQVAFAVGEKPNSSSLRNLSADSKASLKQMILMNGRIEQACDDHDPDACLRSSVEQSPTRKTKGEAADTVKISTASLEKSPLAESALSTTEIISTSERKELIKGLSDQCKANQASACTRLAKISTEMQKHRTAIQLYKRACDLGDARVCHDLGERLNRSGKTDLASLYLTKACQHGDQSACKAAAATTTGATATTPTTTGTTSVQQ